MPEQTFYYKFPDGSVSVETIGSEGDVIVIPEAPEGAIEIPSAVYLVLLAEIEQATELLLATLRGADQARALEDFTALRAVGIPAVTAARMTGYVDDGDGPIHLPPLPGEGDDGGGDDGPIHLPTLPGAGDVGGVLL